MKNLRKNIVTLFIVLLIGVQCNHLIIYYTLFKANQETLALEVCEQKTDDCNACCYLSKKMAEDTEKADPVNKNATQNDVKISQYTLDLISYHNSSGNNSVSYCDARFNLLTGFLSRLDQPPRI